MALRSPQEISGAVELQDDLTAELRVRFDEDYSLYRLDPFNGIERDDGVESEEGYAHYTSSEPQTFADKIITFVIESKMLLQIKHPNAQERQREADDAKERFLFGILRAADERLVRLMKPRLRHELSFHAAIRGFLFGRAMLVKRPDETTFVDITPWDPLNTYWKMGADGLEWACYRLKKTRDEIKAQYDVDLDSEGSGEGDEGIDVYDFYDNEINTVVTASRVLKPPQAHGSPRIPIFYNVVGAVPMIQSEMSNDTIKDWGESIFKAGRNVYKNYQQMMSIMLELASRSRKPPTDVHSPDGTKTLESDPWVSGSEISTAEGETVKPLELLRSAPDLGPFLALISGEMQRGALPHTAFGELPFQLSGYAIQTLRQGIETILTPRLRAVEEVVQQICRLVSDQYATGSFDNMELSGYDANRQYFREEIDPIAINMAGDIEVKMVSVLPQDDVQKASMAQIMRDGPVPLAHDRWIREEVMGIQDTDNFDTQIKEQTAERMLPEAALFTHMKASEDMGRSDLAGFYYWKLIDAMLQSQIQHGQLMGMAQQSGLLNGAGGQMGAGVPPTAAPPQSFGQGAAPSDLSNPGAQAPPGTPRPGAQTEATRLTNIGLVGPGG